MTQLHPPKGAAAVQVIKFPKPFKHAHPPVRLVGWAWLNLTAWIQHWDPYPFILMNLFLSLQAAYTAPVLMMSQNRLAARDRLEAHNDYEINRKTEEEVCAVLEHLTAQDAALSKIVEAMAARMHGNEKG